MTPQGSPVVEAAAWFPVWGSSINMREVVKYAEVIGRRKEGLELPCCWSVLCLCGGRAAMQVEPCLQHPDEGHTVAEIQPTWLTRPPSWKEVYIPRERGTSLGLCPGALCGPAGPSSDCSRTSPHEGLCSRFS